MWLQGCFTSQAPFDVRDGSKSSPQRQRLCRKLRGKSKGKDFGAGQSGSQCSSSVGKGKPKGKGKWGKWNDGWDDSRGEELPPGYGQKVWPYVSHHSVCQGKPSWFEESQEMPHGRHCVIVDLEVNKVEQRNSADFIIYIYSDLV